MWSLAIWGSYQFKIKLFYLLIKKNNDFKFKKSCCTCCCTMYLQYKCCLPCTKVKIIKIWYVKSKSKKAKVVPVAAQCTGAGARAVAAQCCCAAAVTPPNLQSSGWCAPLYRTHPNVFVQLFSSVNLIMC